MMEITAEIRALIDKAAAGMELAGDEYIDPADGLIHCKKCGGQRQTVVPCFGKPGYFMPRCICQCQREAEEQRKAAEERQRRMERIKRRKAQGLQDRYLYDYTFANDNGQNPLMDKARAYVENWKEAYKNNTGLLLFGDVGTGKSFFAGCIANALLDRDVPVLMTNFPTILNRLTGMFSEDRAEFIASFDEYDLLIIDDLGVERSTEYAMEQMFFVIDSRYSRCTKGYYMRGRTPYGFDTEPIVMDGIKTKKLVENAEMDFAELMFQMYAEPGNSYGDITRYFVKHSIKVYDKALQRAFISKLLRNPVYVQADMDIYEYFKAQGVKIESPPEMFTGDNSCYLYQGREGEEQILVIAPHQGRISSQLWLTVQRKLSQNTSFQNGRKCHNTWLAGKIKCGRCGYALTALRAQNGVTYLRCKQRADNGSCEGAGTLTAQSMESFVYGEMVEKMRKYHTLKGGKEQGYNPKLTAARVALAKTESEIEKLLDTLSGANPLLLQYANNRIEELDTERQKQLKLVADLTANSVSDTQIDCITNYLNDWESVSFDDKRKVVDILISHIDATSESVTIHWKI